jgi:hypothetical protein
MKYKLATGTDHEFFVDLPFKTRKEMLKSRKKFLEENFPQRKPQSACYEFFLQFLPKTYTLKYIEPNRASNLANYIRKYGEEIGQQKYNEKIENDKYKGTLPAFIARYGEIEGTRKYKEKNAKLSVSVDSLRLSGHTEEEIKKIKETHGRKSNNSLSNFIERYGIEEGTKKFEKYIENHPSFFGVRYWIEKGFSEEEAKKIVSDLQRRDLQYFITKFGEETGTFRYHKSVIGRMTGINTGAMVSKLETISYHEIKKSYPDAENSKPIDNYVVDIYLPSINYIIEIYGDYWHCNPKYWPEDKINKTLKMTAKQRWDKDKIRENRLIEKGYNMICLWESDILEKGIVETLNSKLSIK